MSRLPLPSSHELSLEVNHIEINHWNHYHHHQRRNNPAGDHLIRVDKLNLFEYIVQSAAAVVVVVDR